MNNIVLTKLKQLFAARNKKFKTLEDVTNANESDIKSITSITDKFIPENVENFQQLNDIITYYVQNLLEKDQYSFFSLALGYHLGGLENEKNVNKQTLTTLRRLFEAHLPKTDLAKADMVDKLYKENSKAVSMVEKICDNWNTCQDNGCPKGRGRWTPNNFFHNAYIFFTQSAQSSFFDSVALLTQAKAIKNTNFKEQYDDIHNTLMYGWILDDITTLDGDYRVGDETMNGVFTETFNNDYVSQIDELPKNKNGQVSAGSFSIDKYKTFKLKVQACIKFIDKSVEILSPYTKFITFDNHKRLFINEHEPNKHIDVNDVIKNTVEKEISQSGLDRFIRVKWDIVYNSIYQFFIDTRKELKNYYENYNETLSKQQNNDLITLEASIQNCLVKMERFFSVASTRNYDSNRNKARAYWTQKDADELARTTLEEYERAYHVKPNNDILPSSRFEWYDLLDKAEQTNQDPWELLPPPDEY